MLNVFGSGFGRCRILNHTTYEYNLYHIIYAVHKHNDLCDTKRAILLYEAGLSSNDISSNGIDDVVWYFTGVVRLYADCALDCSWLNLTSH